MMIYDVEEKKQKLRDILKQLDKMIDEDEIEGINILYLTKDFEFFQYHFDGRIDPITWIGICSLVKEHYLSKVYYD